MVAETSEASKDQQNESATNEKNLFENLSELDLERYLRLNNHTRPRKTLTGVFLRPRASFKFKLISFSCMVKNKHMKCCNLT